MIIRLLCLFLIAPLLCPAQRNLSKGRQTSVYTYVYKISPSETWSLSRSGMKKFSEKFLHTLIDSFSTDSHKEPQLPPGNYLLVHAFKTKLEAKLKTVGDLQFELINNNRDLVFFLHDKNAQPVHDARAMIGRKKIPYDSKLQTYRLDARKRAGTVKVYYQNALHLFPIQQRIRPGRKWPRINLYRGRMHYYRYFSGSTKYEKHFKGFVAFNKPMYKPGDTLKLKAFIYNKQGKPVNRPLLLRLSDESFDVDTIIAAIQPYRPGGYEYTFVLNDSIDLDLDTEYLLTLEEMSSRKYDVNEYYGRLDDDEYAAKRKVLVRKTFNYEEYELSSVQFEARTDLSEHHRGRPVALYLKATDENDLAVQDGRVEVVIKAGSYNIGFHTPTLFLPDTLWRYSQPLDGLGETKIIVPDSIFPAADFDYEINCTFLNSNNEEQEKSIDQHFYNSPWEIQYTSRKDSLDLSCLRSGKSIAVHATLYAFNSDNDTLLQRSLSLPASIAMHPVATKYRVETDSLHDQFTLSKPVAPVNCQALRTKDSITIQVINKQKLFFWYAIYAGKKIVQRGYSDSLLYYEKLKTPGNYWVSLQYIYAGKVYNESYTIPNQDKQLNIEVNQPDVVYPGKTTNIDILVKDVSGKPVPDADITAYAFTDKFKEHVAPSIPYLGRRYPLPKAKNSFMEGHLPESSGDIDLRWKRWSKEMGLDSLEYYRFLHPDSIYTNTEDAKRGITQIAPFVVLNGYVQPVHQVYIDEAPVFFSQAQHLEQYSFPVKPGKHSLRLRTSMYMVQVDSIWAAENKKTFISINANPGVNKSVTLIKMRNTLTSYEKMLWSRYMLLIEDNFDDDFAYIKNDNQFYLLNAWRQHAYRNRLPILTGPFFHSQGSLTVKNRFMQPFDIEGSYQYTITNGLIKLKQLSNGSLGFSPQLSMGTPAMNFSDYVLTEEDLDSMWREYIYDRSANVQIFKNPALNGYGNGRLSIEVDTAHTLFPKNIFLFRYDDPDFLRIFRGKERKLGYLEPGVYRLFVLLKDDRYLIRDSIRIQENGTNYYSLASLNPQTEDSVSQVIARIVNARKRSNQNINDNWDVDRIKETFNFKHLNKALLQRQVSGQVISEKTKEPIMNATVRIKGTNILTITDVNGNFRMKVTANGTLEVSMVGFNTKEIRLSGNDIYLVQLHEAANNLNEVVVVGYGIARKSAFTGSIALVNSSLQGQLPGIIVRGAASVSQTKPLIIVDGLPYDGSLEDLDPAFISSTTVLKGDKAIAMYGSRAAAGVVIITTNKAQTVATQENEAPTGQSIRRNFRDDAYWQPRLRTDAQGKASFTVTYPDDITKWRSFFIAMGPKKQTGSLEQSIRSFKQVSGNLALPAFAIAGDSMNVIGKSLNYLADQISLTRTFSINNGIPKKDLISLRNVHIDTFNVAVEAKDSLKLQYAIQKEDGYFDGEERTIPVFPAGTIETHGYFAALGNDTTITISLPADTGKVKVYAETALLPVLLDEVEHLRNYEYLCNEQLASKLTALLLKKKVYTYLGKDFRDEKEIKGIIKKLDDNKSMEGLWGWWKNNSTTAWISLHVAEALLMAREQKYPVSLNKQLITDYCLYSLNRDNDLFTLHLLQLTGSKADLRPFIDTLEKNSGKFNLYQLLRLQEIKQLAGLPVNMDTLVTRHHLTAFGNMYWGDDTYNFFDNSIHNTVVMYRLLKRTGGYENILQKIRNYFLEKRKDGKWRNTYESSLILETILPDLLQEQRSGPASISIDGKAVHSFPYAAELNNNFTVTKQGALPVYFTAYRTYWNKNPEKISGNFTVNSSFEKTVLKAGEEVDLKVQVTVKADADYVMIEVPIPAGCSYKNKSQGNFEVHREYFKNKVSIFCTSLPKGNYTFTVNLMPRYTGSYHLNPARAEMMYFPVFNGQEAMKKVIIQ